jgi:transcriptional repressor NrdR
MRCPFCSHDDSKVIDKRETGNNQEITRRRRECLGCGKRFTTYETVEETNFVIVKKDGRRESFNRQKLMQGILKACEKRPVSMEQVEQLVTNVEGSLRSMGKNEIETTILGEQIMNELELLDKVAYIRFASVYRDFADLNSFQSELKKLIEKNKNSK